MDRKTISDDLARARDRLEAQPIAPRSEPPAAATPGSTTGPRAAAWVGALLYAFFALVSSGFLGSLWGVLGFACLSGGALVALSPLAVRHRRRILAGALAIAGGLLVGGAWGLVMAAFGAETDAQLAALTVVFGAFFAWPPVLVGLMLVRSRP